MPKPRIAILHYAAPPVVGGVESTIGAHAKLLADHGYAVRVLAGRAEPFDRRVPVRAIPVVDSRDATVSTVNRELANGIVTNGFYTLTQDIRRVLQDALADIDICIAHNLATLHKNIALTSALYAIAQERRVRVIAWCHDFAWSDPLYARDLHPGLPWDWLRQAWPGVKYVVVSDNRRKELARLLGLSEGEISVVPPGVDAAEFLGLGPTTARWMSEFHWLDAEPLLLLPARVTRRKNIELAIEITSALRDRGSQPKLIVMGPLGPHNPANVAYLEELNALRRARAIEDDVIFLQQHGAVDDATRRDLYGLADALLFPSEREGFGIPILEAALTRLPIFCSDIPPFRESAGSRANYFGLAESPVAIAERIQRILAQDSHYAFKKQVVRTYHWPRIFEEQIEPLLLH